MVERNKLYKIIMYACLAGLALCILYLIVYGINTKKTRLEQERLEGQYVEMESSEEVVEEVVEATPEPTLDPSRLVIGDVVYDSIDNYTLPLESVDFESLKQENEHIYAWINVPGTQVNDPVLQHPDKAEYYLSRDIKHNWSVYGEIFSQFYNSKDFTDNMTVLYGHNMRNGTMFGDLHKYEDELFFAQNPYIYVYTEDKILIYKIFAAYQYGNLHLLLNFQMNDTDNFGMYLDSVKEIVQSDVNHYDSYANVTSADKVITLSTCVSGNKQLRYLVQGKLVAGKNLIEE